MYFNQDNSVLAPLHKSNRAHDRGSLWNRAYQALKHYRTQSMDKATVRNLLNALGSLYILNLYYRNDSFWYDVPIEGREEYRTHSKIFSPFVCDVSTHLPLCNDDNLLIRNYTLNREFALQCHRYIFYVDTFVKKEGCISF